MARLLNLAMISPIRNCRSVRISRTLQRISFAPSNISLSTRRSLSGSAFSRPIQPNGRRYATLPTARQQLRNISTANRLDPQVLPISCPGCGAYTQWVSPEEAGFYTITRKAVKGYIRQNQQDDVDSSSEKPSLITDDGVTLEQEAANSAPGLESEVQSEKTDKDGNTSNNALPVCDRCHNLVNYGKGQSIPYPPLSYIRDLITESPFRSNHVYHVLDAADFPMSLIRGIDHQLPLQAQRGQNRRSQPTAYDSGRKLAVLNFVITRSDLLAGLKTNADSLMTNMVEVLRDALGSSGNKIRLGNVHMVSANRGWWTKEIKTKIWEHGGGVWMVGKTNVGKSKLMASIFPKTVPAGAKKLEIPSGVTVVGRSTPDSKAQAYLGNTNPDNPQREAAEPTIDPIADNLLPPLREETRFPEFPIASARPGTTASPIRIPFDNHRGEVIDLPGLYRSGLEEFVKDEDKLDLVMTDPPKPTLLTIRPGQSLVIGGLISIKQLEQEGVVLAAAFIPLETHITSTLKASEILSQERKCPIKSIAKDGIGEKITSAGIVELKWDVTKAHAKPLKSGKYSPLYKVMSADILIEGCGWVELTAQIRTKSKTAENPPKVEIFSPEGKFIGSRKPMSAWAFIQEHKNKTRKASSGRRPTSRNRNK